MAAPSIAANAQGDSIKVVKGQVSDYYIPVHKEYHISGTVTDEQGKPLEGATVMFFSSPVHCNTDAKGRYTLKCTDGDRHVYVYYPGMEFGNVMREVEQLEVNVTLKPYTGKAVQRTKAVATRWWDPEDCGTHTYCNPMNISYNYEPYNNNVRPSGSFRSSADPMGLDYKGTNMLFSTNQGGFHYSKNMSDWEFAPASFQRKPTDDDQFADGIELVGTVVVGKVNGYILVVLLHGDASCRHPRLRIDFIECHLIAAIGACDIVADVASLAVGPAGIGYGLAVGINL